MAKLSQMGHFASVLTGWFAQRRAQALLVARFGPMTLLAWASMLRVVVSERLWRIPIQGGRDIATSRSNP